MTKEGLTISSLFLLLWKDEDAGQSSTGSGQVEPSTEVLTYLVRKFQHNEQTQFNSHSIRPCIHPGGIWKRFQEGCHWRQTAFPSSSEDSRRIFHPLIEKTLYHGSFQIFSIPLSLLFYLPHLCLNALSLSLSLPSNSMEYFSFGLTGEFLTPGNMAELYVFIIWVSSQ